MALTGPQLTATGVDLLRTESRTVTPERDHYQVHELFSSIQGEGYQAGIPSAFVRLQGCPVGCSWCDAKLTWFAGGERMSVNHLVDWVVETRRRHVVITGGEPLLVNLDPLIAPLLRLGCHVQIETSGAYPLLGHLHGWLTVSPKRAADWYVDEHVLTRAAEFKFVVDDDFDPADARAVVTRRQRLTRDAGTPIVSLMPEGCPPPDAAVRRTLAMLDDEPSWRFSPRLQYAYAPIAAREGDTNQQITVEAAKEASRAHVRARQ